MIINKTMDFCADILYKPVEKNEPIYIRNNFFTYKGGFYLEIDSVKRIEKNSVILKFSEGKPEEVFLVKEVVNEYYDIFALCDIVGDKYCLGERIVILLNDKNYLLKVSPKDIQIGDTLNSHTVQKIINFTSGSKILFLLDKNSEEIKYLHIEGYNNG